MDYEAWSHKIHLNKTYFSTSSAAKKSPKTWNAPPAVFQQFSAFPHKVKILQGLSLSMQRGQKVAVVGESGSGKSTVMASWMKNTSFNSPQMVAKSKGNGTGKTAVGGILLLGQIWMEPIFLGRESKKCKCFMVIVWKFSWIIVD